MTVYLKDPDSALNYAIDWSANYLGDLLIDSSEWTVNPVEEGGLNVSESSHDGRKTAATMVGGIAGHRYDLTNRVTLSNGESDERSLSFLVEAR